MPISLYDAVIPTQLQILESMRRLIAKAEAFCAERGLSPDEIITARFAPDMEPFAYQIKSLAVHSLGAIEGVRRGSFSPDTTVALRIPIEAGHGFRREAGHHSGLKPAIVPM